MTTMRRIAANALLALLPCCPTCRLSFLTQ
jgi:hypothetical protein